MLPRPLVSAKGVFLAAAVIAFAYAWCTDHTWEDYWITFRAAKNLATGNGLVHNPGHRLHTFTSPLGVLIPALGSFITGNHSDVAALWVFRAASISAFAAAAALMFITAARLGMQHLSVAMLVAWLLTDNKSQDFAANGMEAPFLQFFMAYAIWSVFTQDCRRRWLHLGFAWGGLMWTRPDSFITIGTMSAGILLFGTAARTGLTRRQWMALLAKASVICTIVYLPWFITAWAYYGTPVPHTVIAKASAAGPKNLAGFVWSFIKQPVSGLFTIGPIGVTFMPSNFQFGGWPLAVEYACRVVAVICYIVWLIPAVRWEARLCSLIYAVFIAYLDYFPAYPASWYLPGPTWLGLFGLAGLIDMVLTVKSDGDSRRRRLRQATLLASCAFILLSIWMSLYAGQLFAAQQRFVDGGNRRQIGLWLHDQAKPGDTVFLECLGYIGYYSNLRTFDWPGMSSPEVVKTSREVKHSWPMIVDKLRPTWLVLRPAEANAVLHSNDADIADAYEMVKVFEVTRDLETRELYGEGLLAFDSCFFVFRRIDNVP